MKSPKCCSSPGAWIFCILQLWIYLGDCIKLPGDYDPAIRPNNNLLAAFIKVSAQVISVEDIDPSESHITVDVIIRKEWKDPRLAGLVERDQAFSNKMPEIWVPALEYSQSTSKQQRDGIVAPTTLRLSRDGSVQSAERVKARINCEMSFFRFPFDHQTCFLNIGSYSQTKVHLDLMWHGEPNNDVLVFDSEYVLTGMDQTVVKERTGQGEYVRLVLSVQMSRSLVSWVLVTLLPMLFVLIVTYGTLFMNARTTAGGSPLTVIRLAINAFGILLVAILYQCSTRWSPRSGAVTALHVWTAWISFFTTIFFLVPFLELLHSCLRGQVYMVDTGDHGSKELHNAPHSSSFQLHQKSGEVLLFSRSRLVAKLEKFTKIVCPVSTVVFVIIYFGFYCS